MKISELNKMSREEFVQKLADIYERSPWFAEAAFECAPFADLDELIATFSAVVEGAEEEQQIELIKAHPDLAGKLARAGELTPASTAEQKGVGLDQLSDADFTTFSELNSAYRQRFGFPFIICAREHTLSSILENFSRRLEQDAQEERATALEQIHRIAAYRLADLIDG